MKPVDRGSGIPENRIRRRSIFGAQIKTVKLELNTGDGRAW